MNEETRLTLELEQSRKRLRQARENLRAARREQTLCIAEVDMLAARLVREKYGNIRTAQVYTTQVCTS